MSHRTPFPRIYFYTAYLKQLKRTMDECGDAVGYYACSFKNKFGCAEGFREGFGLIHVDMETDKHTLKDSAKWYRNLIVTNGSEL
tara:strand:+ start:1351 stop:1605 length:255 start_codon:yes stop_codon:yes gene_type:complete